MNALVGRTVKRRIGRKTRAKEGLRRRVNAKMVPEDVKTRNGRGGGEGDEAEVSGNEEVKI